MKSPTLDDIAMLLPAEALEALIEDALEVVSFESDTYAHEARRVAVWAMRNALLVGASPSASTMRAVLLLEETFDISGD